LDALSAAGRDDELKAQLERLPVGVLPRSQDFRLRRAELRASHGECQGALADANAVLTQAQGAVRARAEAVIARCSSAP
jgi:hypothetical protein